MKKNLLSIFAVAVAIGLSAFSAPKHSAVVYNWFSDDPNHDYIGSTSSSTSSPDAGCSKAGSGCLLGFEDSRENPVYPGGPADATFAHNQ